MILKAINTVQIVLEWKGEIKRLQSARETYREGYRWGETEGLIPREGKERLRI